MKTVLNKTHGPLKVHLSRGRLLRLGPGKTGQISVHDGDRESVKQLVAAGKLEVIDDNVSAATRGDSGVGGRSGRRGHHRSFATNKRGDR